MALPPATPEESTFAWARFRRLMGWMLVAAIVAVLLALGWLRWTGVALSIHLVVATAAGVGLSVLLGTALMSLIFLSAGTGHDDRVGDIDEKDET